MSRGRRTALLVAAPVLLLAVAVGLLVVRGGAERAADAGRAGAWATGGTAQQAAEFARLRIPASATDVRWAQRDGFQDDLAVVSFLLPQAEQEGFTATLGSARWTDTRFVPDSALQGFAHIGAPDPARSFPLRQGEFQSQVPGHKAVWTTVWLAPAEGGGGTRVWVQALNV